MWNDFECDGTTRLVCSRPCPTSEPIINPTSSPINTTLSPTFAPIVVFNEEEEEDDENDRVVEENKFDENKVCLHFVRIKFYFMKYVVHNYNFKTKTK